MTDHSGVRQVTCFRTSEGLLFESFDMATISETKALLTEYVHENYTEPEILLGFLYDDDTGHDLWQAYNDALARQKEKNGRKL